MLHFLQLFDAGHMGGFPHWKGFMNVNGTRAERISRWTVFVPEPGH